MFLSLYYREIVKTSHWGFLVGRKLYLRRVLKTPMGKPGPEQPASIRPLLAWKLITISYFTAKITHSSRYFVYKTKKERKN